MLTTNILGKKYEAMACNFLMQKGYKILEQNYSNKIGEIDIICENNGILVFVEVKYRTSAKFGLPLEAITPHKLFKIQNTALVYLKSHKKLNYPYRIDAIEILNDEIRHVENITNSWFKYDYNKELFCLEFNYLNLIFLKDFCFSLIYK